MEDSFESVAAHLVAIDMTLAVFVGFAFHQDRSTIDRLHSAVSGLVGQTVKNMASSGAPEEQLQRFEAQVMVSLDRLLGLAKAIR